MNNSPHHMLTNWYPKRDTSEWVLGTIYKTEGSSYRKAGAMMMFSSSSEQLGLLSGGCLESDIIRLSKKTMYTRQNQLVCYDGTDEDDISYQLGIGCGGVVHIVLQVINKANDYLQLDKLHDAICQRQSAIYQQCVSATVVKNTCQIKRSKHASFRKQQSKLVKINNEQCLQTQFYARPHLLVCGGSFDARPLVSLASQLGWETSVWDPRPANARYEHFNDATTILKDPKCDLSDYISQHGVNAAVMMTHNVDLDSYALQHITMSKVNYMGILGPLHRKEQVIKHAKLEGQLMGKTLHGPIGIEIGAQLPESIALSILAEVHKTLYLEKNDFVLSNLGNTSNSSNSILTISD